MSKYIKYTIIGLIVVSFLFFGIYGTIASSQNYVAKVGGVKISSKEFNDYLSQKRRQIIQNTEGDEVRRNNAIKLMETPDFQKMVINEMINSLVITMFLKENGVNITPDVIAQYIKTLPEFQQDGKFSPKLVQEYTTMLNTTDYNYLKSQIPEARQLIFGKFIENFTFQPSILAGEYVDSQNKKRTVEVLTLFEVETPELDDSDLQNFYESVKHQFVEKPQHHITLSFIDDYISQNTNLFTATPEAIETFYNKQFTGNIVTFYLASFTNEESAKKAYAITTKQGTPLQTIVETMMKSANHSVKDHGVFTSQDFEIPQVLEALQNAKLRSTTPIVKVGNTYTITQVLDIKHQTFSHTTEEITKELQRQRKCSNANVYVEKLRSEFQTGALFEQITLKYGLPISRKIIIDENTGEVKDAQTNRTISIPQVTSEFISTITHNTDTKYGHIFEIDKETCSFAAYRQTYVSKERIKTLPEVRGKVIEMFQKHTQKESKTLVAKNIVEQMQSLKTTLNNYVKHGMVETKTITMNENPDLFTKPINSSFYEVEGSNVLVVKVVSEEKTKTIPTQEAFLKTNQEIQNAFMQSYLQSLLGELYTKYGVNSRI